MRAVLLAMALALAATPTPALEVDPYLAWLVDIADGEPALSRYTTAMIAGHLQAWPGNAAEIECSLAAESSMRRLHRSVMTRRRALAFIRSSPDIETWKPGGLWSSVWRSYYRRLVPLYFSSIAKTIDLDGVRLSLDKVGHFFGFGRRYYRRYRRALAEGMSADEAERQAILWGLKQENLFVGKWIDTIFSHADLEANYQGLRFARDLCEGPDRLLERSEEGWRLARPVDLKRYVTPALDEGFNSNHFTVLGWPLVRPGLKRHCWILEEPEVAKRLADYRRRWSPSVSQQVIASFYAERGIDHPQQAHSLAAVCAAARDDAREDQFAEPEADATGVLSDSVGLP